MGATLAGIGLSILFIMAMAAILVVAADKANKRSRK